MTKRRITGLGVDWYLPGKNRRFATSTKATSDLIELAAREGHTVTSAIEWINYDDDAKEILRHFEQRGYGDTRLDTLVGMTKF